jgi:hypothetical protein
MLNLSKKKNWKVHSDLCKMLKKFLNELQPYDQVKQVIIEAHEKCNARILEHAIAYAHFQLGERVEGKAYRERQDGQQISNFEAEIHILMPLYSEIHAIFGDAATFRQLHQDNMMLSYVQKSLDLLRPWSL